VSEQKVCPTCGTEYPLSERFCPRDGTALRSANASADLLGSVMADRYHILKKLGEGGMGTVYLAEHVKMGRKSALKVMNPGMNTDPDAIARFNREASNASRLSHPNICGIYDFGETPDGLIYLAMEFIEGKALTDLIEGDGALQPARAASIVHQTADALQVAHDAGIVHRDLKPDNIMVTKNRDGSDLVKVVDFGIAKASSSDAQKVTKTGLVVGTPEYMSPEQLAGDKLDGRSDTYSLGLVAFNCLTGKLPFPSESAQEAMIMRLTDRPRTLAEIRPDVEWPEELQAVMDKALARDAADRYQSAAQFGRDFAAVVAEMPAVQATEGATQVIGAMGAPAGKTAPMAAAPMPKTRVAGPGDRPSPAKGNAPAPVAKKTPLVPILGGVAAVAVLGFFGFKQLGGKSETPPVTPPQVAQQTGSQPVTPPDPTPGGTTGANTQQMSNPVNPGTNQPRTEPQPSTPANNPSSSTTAPPATPNVMTQMEGWVAELQAPNVAPRTALRIIAEVEAMQPTLRGIQLAESWYVIFVGRIALLDDAGACEAAKKVRDLHSDQRRVGAANLALEGC
jgi:eukaryotic-like serine/threonine-protein kinase